VIEDIGSNLKKNLGYELVRCGIVIYVGWKCYQSGGKWVFDKTETILNAIKR